MREVWTEGFAGMVRAARHAAGDGPEGGLLLRPGSTIWGSDVPLAAEFSYHRVLTSTNDHLKELVRSGAAGGRVVIAAEQTAGRGRLGRSWFSPPGGGVYVSLLLRPRIPPAATGWITLGAALALVRAAARHGITTGIKWPNDVLCRGRKAAGILVEAGSETRRLTWFVIGTGINLRPAHPMPAGLAERATTLEACAGRAVDADRLLADYLWELWELAPELAVGEDGEVPDCAAEIAGRLTHLGAPVTVRTARGEVSGVTVGLSSEGWLELDGGRTIMTGELLP